MEFFEDSNLEPPTDFVDEFEDTYAPLEEEVDYDYEEFYNSQMMAPFTLEEILHHCIEPTLSDGFRHVGKIVIWCIIFRILTQSCRNFCDSNSYNKHLTYFSQIFFSFQNSKLGGSCPVNHHWNYCFSSFFLHQRDLSDLINLLSLDHASYLQQNRPWLSWFIVCHFMRFLQFNL